MHFRFDQNYRARLLALPRLLARGAQGDRGPAGRMRGGRVEFHEHRAYAPGDDLRDLDWNLFLRHEKLAVKEYARSESPAVDVILDRSGSMGPPGGAKDRLAREIAGGLLYAALAAGSPACLHLCRQGSLRPVAAWRSARETDALLKQLEDLPGPRGATNLGCLRDLPTPPAGGRLAFLLSDFLVEPLPAAGLVALARGAGSGSLLQVVTEEERHPRLPLRGVLRDVEDGGRLELQDPARLLPLYTEELAAHEEAVGQAAAQHGLLHHPVTDSVPFEKAVMSAIGRRRRP